MCLPAGRAEPAADIGYLGACPQLFLHTVKRRDPGRDEAGGIAGLEELLTADEDVRVVLVPAQAAARSEGFGDPRFGLQRSERQHECAWRVDVAVWISQRIRLLLGHRVAIRGRVVFDVAAGRLAAQPFGDVTRAGTRAHRQLVGARRPGGQCLVQAEPVTDDHVPGRHCRPQVRNERAQEFVQLVVVDRHNETPWPPPDAVRARLLPGMAVALQLDCNEHSAEMRPRSSAGYPA